MPGTDIQVGHRVAGRAVPLAAERAAVAGVDSPWNVLAYAVALKARGAELTRQDFADAVANFERYGQVPVVLFHSDTDPTAHPDAAKAHAWLVALRVGEMARGGKTVATLEGRFRWVNASTRADVASGALAFGSITIIQDATDEESGAAIGSYLYSFSLTNNPALVDLPRLAAARDAGAPTPRGPAAPSTSDEESTMKFVALAARYGIAATDEADAEAKLLARVDESAELRRALNLSAAAPSAEVAAKVSALSADAAKVPALEAQVAAASEAEALRLEADRARHIDAVVAARPELKAMRASLEFHAKADWAGFAKAYPLPKPAAGVDVTSLAAENAQLRALVLGARIALPDGAPPPAPLATPQLPVSHVALARELAAELRGKDPKLSERDALLLASKQLKDAARGAAAVRS